MKSAEDACIDEVYKKVKRLWKSLDQPDFVVIDRILNDILVSLEAGTRLPNSDPDPDDFENYPPNYQSSYLRIAQPPTVLQKTTEWVRANPCSCNSSPCQCQIATECTVRVKQIHCEFCPAEFPRDSQAFELKTGGLVCRSCHLFLLEKFDPLGSALDDVQSLVDDACEELLYWQFTKALAFVHQAHQVVQRFQLSHDSRETTGKKVL
jgi:hypothetical protein